jgi:7,8-dihydropterin-6-yl-methyl-4-(beta-D-ribofuranosyl)aminobenzene 5'-phosphate synthase
MAVVADSVELTILVENWIDMLLPDREASPADSLCLHRSGLIDHFDPKLKPPQAENGISILVKVTQGRHSTTIVFDAGLTGSVLAHNLGALGLNPSTVDQVVLSHGHPDHYGGIYTLLGLIGHDTPVVTHPDAFLPRYALMGDGRAAPYYNGALGRSALQEHGGAVILTRESLELGWGAITTGEIPRQVEFEGPKPVTERGAPGLYQVSPEGSFRLDEVWDEQALIVDVKDEGLVVLTGCSHAGVINTLKRAVELCGEKPIRAVLGGFHLGFPTTPVENVEKTLTALQEMEVKTVMPMHCSGLRCHASFAAAFGASYLQPSVGTVLRVGRS